MIDAGILLVPAGISDVWVEEDDIPRFRVSLLSGAGSHHYDASIVFDRARSAVHLGLAEIALGESTPAFVERAMFEGRVVSFRSEDGASYWLPQVTETDPPSVWAMALLAADLWNDPDAYASHLEVCKVCGAVRFDAPSKSLRCELHRHASVSAGGARNITRPEGSNPRQPWPSQF